MIDDPGVEDVHPARTEAYRDGAGLHFRVIPGQRHRGAFEKRFGRPADAAPKNYDHAVSAIIDRVWHEREREQCLS